MRTRKIGLRLAGCLASIALIASSGAGDGASLQENQVVPSLIKEADAADVTIILRPVKSEYCRGERVAIDCVMTNVSSRGYDIFRSYASDFSPTGPEQRLHVEVTRDGKKVPLTRFGGSLGGASGSYRGFGPGSRDTRRFSLNAIYDMTLTGEYQIIAVLPVNGMKSSGRETQSFLAKSAPVVVRVVGDCP